MTDAQRRRKPTPQAAAFRLDPSRPGKSNPPSTPGPPVRRVPLRSAAVGTLEGEQESLFEGGDDAL